MCSSIRTGTVLFSVLNQYLSTTFTKKWQLSYVSGKQNFVNQLGEKIKQRAASKTKLYLHWRDLTGKKTRGVEGRSMISRRRKRPEAWVSYPLLHDGCLLSRMNQHKALRGQVAAPPCSWIDSLQNHGPNKLSSSELIQSLVFCYRNRKRIKGTNSR